MELKPLTSEEREELYKNLDADIIRLQDKLFRYLRKERRKSKETVWYSPLSIALANFVPTAKVEEALKGMMILGVCERNTLNEFSIKKRKMSFDKDTLHKMIETTKKGVKWLNK